MNVKSKIALTLNIGLDVSHLKVVVHPVDNKVREPWVLSSNLEQLVEELQALLSEVVAEDFETHQGLVLSEGLSKERQSHVVDLIISHIQMNQAPVDSDCLSNGFRSIVTALVVGDM